MAAPASLESACRVILLRTVAEKPPSAAFDSKLAG
jgi:hypothetical protein